MPGEIEQIEDMIISDIKTNVVGVVTCDTWQGDIEDLLKQAFRKPAVWVIFGGCKFGQKEVIGPGNVVERTMNYGLALFTESLRSRKRGSRGAYDFIEEITERLKGKRLTPLRGYLWPVSAELMVIKGGTFVYGMEFQRIAKQ